MKILRTPYYTALIAGFIPTYANAVTAPVLADTHFLFNSTSNFGGDPLVRVSREYKAFLQFNSSALPNPSEIKKATLFIYVKRMGSAGGLIINSSGTWDEGTLTFFAQPIIGATPTVTSGVIDPYALPASFDGYYVGIDVTPLVTTGAYRFAIGDNPSHKTDIYFDSKESIDTSHPAYLDIALTVLAPSTKMCSAITVSNSRNSLPVPQTWTAFTCRNFMSVTGAATFRLGCIFANSFSFGPTGGGIPIPNCGW